MVKTVVVSGASGLLGRAVYETFKKYDVDTIGLAHSRVSGDLVKLDLTNQSEVEEFFDKTQPNFFIHCAAERRPDVAENDKDHTDNINVQVPEFLAKQCAKHNCDLIYICTDYIFDGTSPPYQVDSEPNPLNHYGVSKLEGERAIHRVYPRAISVRVPVLYGDVQYPGESAINTLVTTVKQTDKNKVVDHHATRFPTHVKDIAQSLYELTEKISNKDTAFPNVIHISSDKALTKYDMCKIFGKILDVNIDHLEPELEVPKDATALRPENCELCTTETLDMGISPCSTNFEDWFKNHLKAKADIY